jgi:hypothetical protein
MAKNKWSYTPLQNMTYIANTYIKWPMAQKVDTWKTKKPVR